MDLLTCLLLLVLLVDLIAITFAYLTDSGKKDK